MKKKFTLITSRRLSALKNMLLDSYLAFHENGSYIRIYDWQYATISLGISNSTSLLDLEKIKLYNIDLIKRETGGGYLNHFDDVCFAFIGNGTYRPMHNYNSVRATMQEFLASMGLPIIRQEEKHSTDFHNSLFCYNIINSHEISIGGKKIIGIAQKLKKNRSLIHGSISFKPPQFDFTQLYKNVTIDQSVIGYLADLLAVNKDELVSRLEKFFIQTYDIEIEPVDSILYSDPFQDYQQKHARNFSLAVF